MATKIFNGPHIRDELAEKGLRSPLILNWMSLFCTFETREKLLILSLNSFFIQLLWSEVTKFSAPSTILAILKFFSLGDFHGFVLAHLLFSQHVCDCRWLQGERMMSPSGDDFTIRDAIKVATDSQCGERTASGVTFWLGYANTWAMNSTVLMQIQVPLEWSRNNVWPADRWVKERGATAAATPVWIDTESF